MNDEMKELFDFQKYKIQEGHVRTHYDTYTNEIISCEYYRKHDRYGMVAVIDSQILPSEDGEWMKVVDAQEIYERGFKDGVEKIRLNIIENIFSVND